MSSSVNTPLAQEKPPETQAQTEQQLNFARLRQEKERFAQLAEQEKQARLQLEERLRQFEQSKSRQEDPDDDEEDSEPYVDRKKLNKVLSKWEQKFDQKVEEKVAKRLEDERKKDYLIRLKSEYKDFDEVLNAETAEKFSQDHPGLAKNILDLPDEYQRTKMAYETMKSLGVHKKPEAKPIQDKINENQRQLYFRPSTVSGPGTNSVDFSVQGQKAAFDKMKQLQARVNRPY